MVKQKKHHRVKKQVSSTLFLGNLDEVLHSDEQLLLAEALQTRPPKAIRMRPPQARGLALERPLPFSSDSVPWYAAGHFCNEAHQPGRFLQHAAGVYFVQDAGSMLALRLLDVQPHEWVADICAAPGAKASAILEKVGPGNGFLLANEPIRGRLPALEFNLARVGFPRYCITSKDPERLSPQWKQQFDAALIDAPCTGQMLVGRGKQSFAAFTESQIAHSAARQLRIVSAASSLVRPGGRLVYSTCTFAPTENEDVIETFLATHEGWHVEHVAELQQWQSPRSPGGYRLYPHRDRCAGAYAVRLRLSGNREPEQKSSRQKEMKDEPLVLGKDSVGSTRGGCRIQHGNRWEEVPSDIERKIEVSCGRHGEIAYRPAKQWRPSHALGLRRDQYWSPSGTHELDDYGAQQFMQGLSLPPGPLGWVVASWRGHPLGWLRGNKERLNNGLPASARLGFIPIV